METISVVMIVSVVLAMMGETAAQSMAPSPFDCTNRNVKCPGWSIFCDFDSNVALRDYVRESCPTTCGINGCSVGPVLQPGSTTTDVPLDRDADADAEDRKGSKSKKDNKSNKKSKESGKKSKQFKHKDDLTMRQSKAVKNSTWLATAGVFLGVVSVGAVAKWYKSRQEKKFSVEPAYSVDDENAYILGAM